MTSPYDVSVYGSLSSSAEGKGHAGRVDAKGARKGANVAVSGVFGGGCSAFGVGGTTRLLNEVDAVEIIYDHNQ